MTFPSIEDLINKAWPRDPARNVNTALDVHEQHYGLNHTSEDIIKGIGQ